VNLSHKSNTFFEGAVLNGTDRGLRGAMGSSKSRHLGLKGRWDDNVGE